MRTDDARREFETHPMVVDAVARGLSLERYRKFLLELYHIVWHFNPVSAAAAARLGDDFRDVRYFLYDHMSEEKGHEQWVLQDLAAMGVPVEQTLSHEPHPFTLTLTGYNYWATEHRHPCAVLGMLYALEVMASVYGGPFTSALRESLLLDGEQGVSFISSHATLDSEHMAELREVLDKVEDPAALEAIAQAVRVNFHHFTRIIDTA